MLRQKAGISDEDTMPRIPEAAWFGLFETWREIIAPCTEASLESLWSAFLVAVGLICGRNIRVENPRPLYPNFYTMNLGVTGDSRKSTALWFCESGIRQVGEEVEIIRGIVSTEGIYERLSAEKHPGGAKALGYVDELRALLAVAKRRGTQDLLPKLNTLYYCVEEDSIDRREKSTTIRRPFFSLIAATPLEYVTDLLGNQEIVGGTLNRFLPIAGPEQPPKPRAKPPSEAAWDAIANPLRQVREHLVAAPVNIAWGDPEAVALWDSFYIAWKEARRRRSRVEADLTARTDEHILKIALVFTALSGEHDFTAEIIARAIAVGEWLEKSNLHLFRGVGQDQITQAQDRIMAVVKSAGGQMRTRDLQQRLSKEMRAEAFRTAYRGLLEADRLVENDESQLSGQIAKVVRIPDNI